MSKDKGKVKGGEKLHKRFEKIKRDALKELKFSIGRSVLLVQSTAVQSIQAGGMGEVVVRYNPTRTHSASGYAPNNLEPRPFMRPALMENKQKIESIIRSGDFVR